MPCYALLKVWAHTAAVIEPVSFHPEEREVLFLPDTALRVINWYPATDFNHIHTPYNLTSTPPCRYPATDFNLRRGLKWDADEERAFTLECQHIVQPNPIEYEDNLALLRERLTGNKVIMIELEEVLLTEKERHEAEELLLQERHVAEQQLEALLSEKVAGDAEQLEEDLNKRILVAVKCGVRDDVVRRARLHVHKLKKAQHDKELERMDASLRAFEPILETLCRTAGGAGEAAGAWEEKLARLEELELIVTRNPRRQVEVEELAARTTSAAATSSPSTAGSRTRAPAPRSARRSACSCATRRTR
jgi:hypothetical protein